MVIPSESTVEGGEGRDVSHLRESRNEFLKTIAEYADGSRGFLSFHDAAPERKKL